MAIPRVFISSTCYDLKYIRENIKYFVNSLGYESILSEDGDVFYNPDIHTHDACLNEVGTCQIFVLIIGGRFGGKYLQEDKSITNKEYEEAVRLKIPVFTLVEKNVLNDHYVFQKNKDNTEAGKIIYPNVDNIKIFNFIDEVRKNNYNNALYPFADCQEIENYLKKQWAGMMYNFLSNSIETKQVSELFEEIHKATDKIEYYTKQVALNVSDRHTNLLIKCYEVMINKEIMQELGYWRIKVSPYMIIKNESLDGVCDNKIEIEIGQDGDTITWGGPPYKCSQNRYNGMFRQYQGLRNQLLQILKDNAYSVEEFLEKESNSDDIECS